MYNQKLSIAHIGSYDKNLGDNIAILNIRNELNKYFSNINWCNVDISKFWDVNNNIEYVKNFFSTNNFDLIIIGGGGLIEYIGYEKQQTHYKLPFNYEILKSIRIPILCISLGINYFRGREGFSEEAKNSLRDLINYSSSFSLRNDGSIQILKDLGLYTEKVLEIPDPGLIFEFQKIENFHNLKKNILQPAFNQKNIINLNRFNGQENLDNFINLIDKFNLRIMPHTYKDYRYFNEFVIPKDDSKHFFSFKNTYQCIKEYLDFDSLIALRGHGQLISIGLNIPGIYFSTQDKVRDFSMIHGFSDYCIDINQNTWIPELKEKFTLLTSDSYYRKNWYKIREEKIISFRKLFIDYLFQCAQKINAIPLSDSSKNYQQKKKSRFFFFQKN